MLKLACSHILKTGVQTTDLVSQLDDIKNACERCV